MSKAQENKKLKTINSSKNEIMISANDGLVNDTTYYSLIASVVTYDVNDEPDIFEIPISPRLRKLKDVSFYCNLIGYLLPHLLHEEVATSEGE